MLFVESYDMNCPCCFLRISEAKTTLVCPMRAAVVGAAEAIDVCSPPGINVPVMIHDRHVIIHGFSVIVCWVRVGVLGCVIPVVVIC